MTVTIEKGEEMNSKEVNPSDPSSYGCEVLLEETTLDLANDKSFPTDAKLIWYLKDGKECMDLVRCKKSVDLFDMYFDKYGPGSVQKIDFGYGSVRPKLWGYKSPAEKKKKR